MLLHTQLLMKSKSSNTAIVGKTEGKKKCLSSQEVQEIKGSKKRGVYVAKKATSTNMTPPVSPGPDRRIIWQNGKDPADTLKLLKRVSAVSNRVPKRPLSGSPKPIKRPDKRSFLNSVLNILSQETTATQFPEVEKNKTKKHKFWRKRTDITRIEKATQDLDAIFNDTPLIDRIPPIPGSNAGERNKSPSPQRERKPRFRSKILNERVDEKMLILKAKREILNTPSVNYSSSANSKIIVEDHKSPDLKNPTPSFADKITAHASNSTVEKKNPKDKKENSKYGPDKEKYDAKDSKKQKKKAVVRIEEPAVTLASEPTDKNEPDTSKNLYNLFVDLLDEDEKPLDIAKMEMEEHVAKKINFQEQVNVKPSSANLEHTKSPTVASAKSVSKVSKAKRSAIADDGVTDRIEEVKPNPKSIIRKSAAPHVIPIENLPYDSVLRSASFEYYNNTRPASPVNKMYMRSVSPESNINMRSASFGYNNNMRSNYFGYNNMRPSFFGYNNNMRSNSFGFNNMRSASFGYNNNMRSNSFGFSNMRSPFGYNNNMRSNSFGYNNMRSASFRAKNKKSAPFGYQNMKFASPGYPKSFYSRISSEKPKKKPSLKKYKKPNLLNILKRELQMEDNWYEEPESFHQALKVIAKNQRRTRKAIHFDESTFVRRYDDDDDDYDDDDDDDDDDERSECIFKRRRIISERGKKKQRKRQYNRYPFDSIYENPAPKTIVVANYPPTRKGIYKDYENAYYSPSYHSLEVNGYDYETNDRLRMIDTMNKPIFYALPSEQYISVESVALESKKSILAESLHSATSLTCKIDGNCETRLSDTSFKINAWANQQSIHSMASSRSYASTTMSQLLQDLDDDVTL